MSTDEWAALEADLLVAGFVLADYPERLTLRALRNMVANVRRRSALGRVLFGQVSDWGQAEEILAVIAETLRDANWQRAGNKNAAQPERYPRPALDGRPAADRPGTTTSVKHYGGEPMTIDEFQKRWEAAA